MKRPTYTLSYNYGKKDPFKDQLYRKIITTYPYLFSSYIMYIYIYIYTQVSSHKSGLKLSDP